MFGLSGRPSLGGASYMRALNVNEQGQGSRGQHSKAQFLCEPALSLTQIRSNAKYSPPGQRLQKYDKRVQAYGKDLALNPSTTEVSHTLAELAMCSYDH